MGRRPQTHCHKGHPLKDPNLVYRDGGKARECRKCFNARFRKKRKDKKVKIGKKDRIDRRGAETSAAVDSVAEQANAAETGGERQGIFPGLAGPEVEPAGAVEALDAIDELVSESETETIAERYLENLAEMSAEEFTAETGFADGGIVQGGPPVLVGETVTDFALPRAVADELEAVAKSVGKSGPMGGEVIAIEAGAINMKREQAPEPPKPAPRPGCPHGFANAIICPTCRSMR
jgi:hypothetical protein